MSRPSAGQLAQVACLLEVTARKPGNVHRFRDFDDATYLDFALSASAIGPAMDAAGTLGVGAAVLAAVEATRRVVATNTNLGMILLLAPLCAAWTERAGDLAGATLRVLDGLTIQDARLAYRAIRLARPAGLGEAAEQDVAEEPTAPLRQVMTLAADRDLVARQYANNYQEVFGLALPTLRNALESGRPLEEAIVAAFLALLAAHPDTLIRRKRGPEVAAEASRRAAQARTSPTRDDLDAWLRADGHARNPGATADLIGAALYAALDDGTIPLPRPAGPESWTHATLGNPR